MKKLLAILLVCCFVFAFAACGNDDTDDSKTETSSKTSNDVSIAEVTSEDESVPEESSQTADVSDETSEEDNTEQPTAISQYISWAGNYVVSGGMTTQSADDTTSLKLTKVNDDVVEGDVGIFTRDYGTTIKDSAQDYSDFIIGVFKYDHSAFSYKLDSMSEVGTGDAEQAIPEDGYVLAIHKNYADKAKAMVEASNDPSVIFFPRGVVVSRGLEAKIKKAATAPVLDGNISESEYGSLIWDVQPDNAFVNYAQFEANNYYATAKVYITYDDENVYLGVVVDTPYHSNSYTQTQAGQMWNSDCIQVNLSVYPADSEYIFRHWNHSGKDYDAQEKNLVRQYGFAVNTSGETLQTIWLTGGGTNNANAKVVRDDGAGKTYYEVKIPFADLGNDTDGRIAVEEGTRFGLSLSFNCGGGSDATFKNVILRDGGGIISINDWSKIPIITLG